MSSGSRYTQLTQARSLLFAPASNARMVGKALDSVADAVILDLEDAVAPGRLHEARATVAAATRREDGPLLTVRVNHPSRGMLAEDVAAAVATAPAAIMLPKAEYAADVRVLAECLDAAERASGLEPMSIAIIPLIESGLGLHHCFDIGAASPRVAGLAFSSGEEGDFMTDIGAQWSADGAALLYARSKLVCENRAAGHVWALDGVFMNLADEAAFEAECRLARRLGFQGKLAIHPHQLPVLHRVFSPTADEVERARRLLDAYAAAEHAGTGAIDVDGMMVDRANAVRAERVLAAAARDEARRNRSIA